MSDNVTKGADEKFCSSCGAIIKIAAEICPKCGVRQIANTSSEDPNASKKSRTTTLLLCIFLGALGAHRFYTGKIGTGIVWLCIFIASVVSGHFLLLLVIWFIDIILILAGKFKDKEGKKVLNW